MAFEEEQHARQEEVRKMYYGEENRACGSDGAEVSAVATGFAYDTYMTDCPADIPLMEVSAEEVMPYFDWKMFYAIWGVKYGGAVPEAMELMQLRRDAEDEIALGDFRIMLSARFFMGCSTLSDCIRFEADGAERVLPMMRQENGKEMSLCDFVISGQSGRKSPFGMFAISVHKRSKAHVHGCSCPACSNHYEDLVGRTVRMTLAEAASAWLDALLLQAAHQIKIIKPAAGYASCPDHTLKGDILQILGGLEIELTESYAMVPESSICGMIFMHPEAIYPEIRRISREKYDSYAECRGMDDEKARRFLGHLLK